MLSMEAIADPPAYDRARAAVRYDDVARTLVHAFKYGDRLDLAPTMGRWMARAGRELLADADALVPVPLHWRRLWARRFNQSALLAEIDRQDRRRPVAHDALKRVKATPQQVGLSQGRARRQCAGRVPRARRRQGRGRRPAARAGRRRADLRRDRRTPAPGRCCGPAPRKVDVLVSRGLWTPVRAPI